jgi:hypothetical protein
MLRDMGFVFHLTSRVKQSIVASKRPIASR